MLLKSLGQLLSLLLMMCQLTAGGGVLPTEILPGFYKAIHPYMPMTYAVNALRDAILGVEPHNYHVSIAGPGRNRDIFRPSNSAYPHISKTKKAPAEALQAV